MDSVRCGYATEGQGVTPLGAAIDGGLMREQGLDVTLDKLGDAHAVSAALASGEIAFGNLAAPGLVDAVAHGAELVFLAGGVNQHFLVGRPGSTLQDVAGQPLGAGQRADMTDFLIEITMDRVLGVAGEVYYGGGSRPRLEALLEGRFAATPLSPPVAIEAREAGCPWLYDYGELGLNFAIGGIAAARSLILEQPELVDRFLRGYLLGQRRYQRERAFGIDVQARYGEIPRDIAEATYDVTHLGFREVPDPATGGMRLLIDFWKAKGSLPASFSLDDVADAGPVLSACAALG